MGKLEMWNIKCETIFVQQMQYTPLQEAGVEVLVSRRNKIAEPGSDVDLGW